MIQIITGHEDVEGSDCADEEAKRAAQGDTLSVAQIRGLCAPLPRSSAALGAEAKRKTTRNWAKLWRQSPQARNLKAMGLQPPMNWIHLLYAGRSRAECAILTQLHTGHVPLNAFLHRIARADSPLCTYCHVPETVDHYLLCCRRYTAQWARLKTAHHSGRIGLHLLLSPGRKVGALLEYLRTTRRFPDIIKTPAPPV